MEEVRQRVTLMTVMIFTKKLCNLPGLGLLGPTSRARPKNDVNKLVSADQAGAQPQNDVSHFAILKD